MFVKRPMFFLRYVPLSDTLGSTLFQLCEEFIYRLQFNSLLQRQFSLKLTAWRASIRIYTSLLRTWVWWFIDEHGVHGHDIPTHETLHILHNLHSVTWKKWTFRNGVMCCQLVRDNLFCLSQTIGSSRKILITWTSLQICWHIYWYW